MFKKISQKLKNLVKKTDPVDPSTFNDPIAELVGWTPLAGGGSNFGTHTLNTDNPHLVRFKVSAGGLLFALVFFLIGIGVVIGVTLSKLSSETLGFNVDSFGPIGIGSVFAIIGAWMFISFSSPIVFDKRREYFWKGRKDPDLARNKNELKVFAEFKDIYAIQLIKEYCTGDKSSYYSYELNLILKNKERLNVIDHGNLEDIRKDSKELSEMLNVPIWDAI